jgi:ribonuclease HII
MGYSVPEHCAALVRLGPTIHHRRSFAPVAAQYGGGDGSSAAAAEVMPGLLLPDRGVPG